MPELPEVEHLRRSIDPFLVGSRVLSVDVRRRGVVEVDGATRGGDRNRVACALLEGGTVRSTRRHGKQMALVAEDGRVVVVQLGMTGSVGFERGAWPRGMEARHRHVVWTILRSDGESWRMVFRDPRRFGGLTALADDSALRTRWSVLGPDALDIDAERLADALGRTSKAIKVALLDQTLVAGVGNIYADEALFAAKIDPRSVACRVPEARVGVLAGELRRILRRAVEAGGSTLRDYRDAFGQPGDAVQTHAAYGRGGQPCLACGDMLHQFTLQARTTVFCPRCQDLST
ncbi:MAG: bifunctional DNA-formamidopyrimidine glycosylase/DNA-(apurinic or apyrimidinic site) lyase [Planctomycetota bacterium]